MNTLVRVAVVVLGALYLSCGGDDTIAPPIDGPVSTECNLLSQTGCAAGEKCTWIRLQVGDLEAQQLGQIGCAPVGDKPILADCQWRPAGATGWDDCVGGAVCLAPPNTDAAVG